MFGFFRLAISKIDDYSIKVIRALSVKARFILMVIIISITPILSLGVISYIKSDIDIVSKISVYSLQIVKQLSLTINAKLFSWEQYGNIIATSEDAQSILRNYDQMNEADQYLAGKTLEKIMKEALKVSLDILEPDIITTNSNVISPMSYTTSNTSPFINNIAGAEKIKEMTKAADGNYIWYTEGISQKAYKGLIVLSRSIKDINKFDKSLGYLMLRVDTNYLYSLYENVDLGSGSKIYLVNSGFMVVLSGDREEIGTNFSLEISESIREKIEQGYMDGTLKNADDKYLVAFSSVPVSGWTVVALIPNTYLKGLSNDIRDLVIVIGVVCLIVSLMFFSLIYRSITNPLSYLIKSMREVEKGHLECRTVEEDERDEVGKVITSYNKMINDLNLHIEDIKIKEKQKAAAEFRALQAQINPHFIANTLNNVAWLAKMQKAENIETMVTSLIQLLNASMGRGNDLITIREEIQNIKSYISLQEFKHFRKIDMHYDIDDDIVDYKLLRFILQPIIENAVIHGLGPKQGQGLISLKGYIDSDGITIIVTDTGVGMSEDDVKNLLSRERELKDGFSSIGLKNVQERIRLAYGDKYGLLIKSEEGMFTTVEVKLPLLS